MELVRLWWDSATSLGPVFHFILVGYLFAWAVMLTRERFAVARTLAAHVGLWGIIGTYVSLIQSLRIDLSGDGLKEFQQLLSFGPASSLVGLTLYLAMNLLHHFAVDEEG